MNADVLTARVADGIAVITLGSAKRIYFDAEIGDALTEAPREAERKGLVHETVSGRDLDRAVEIAQRLASFPPESVAYIKRLVRNATGTPLAQGLALERNLFLKLCISDPALPRMRSYEEAHITSPSRSIVVDKEYGS